VKIIGEHQCEFRRNRSATDHIFCFRQVPEKKWAYNEAVQQPFVDFQKAYDSVRREVPYNILIDFDIPMKLVRLIKMCLNETYNRVQIGKHSSVMFPTRNGLKQDTLSSIIFNFALEYAIRRAQVNQDGLKLNSTHRLMVYADDVGILGGTNNKKIQKH